MKIHEYIIKNTNSNKETLVWVAKFKPSRKWLTIERFQWQWYQKGTKLKYEQTTIVTLDLENQVCE